MRICGKIRTRLVQFVEMNFNGYLRVKGKNGNFFRKYKSRLIANKYVFRLNAILI